VSTLPVVVETAISPLRLLGEDQVYDTAGLIEQGLSTLDAGTSIVHHHHDFRAGFAAGNTDFTNAECTKAIVDLTKSVGRPIAYGNDYIRAALAATPAYPPPNQAEAGPRV